MAENRALKRIFKNLEYIKSKTKDLGRNPQISDVKMCLAILSDEWKDFEKIEKSVDGEFSVAQAEIVDKIEVSYFEVKQLLYKYEKNYEAESARENVPMENLLANQTQFIQEISLLNKRESDVRLPRVNIPTFSGKYSEFPSFKDLFEASIDKNESMSNVHKLQYLKGLLKGEAYGLISHITVTEANYVQAWEKVQNRYNKPKHVVFTLLKQFMDQPMLQQSSAKGLRAITDISDEVIRGLHVLGEKAELRDPWLVYILVNKLDAESKEAWAHETAEEDFPSLERFFKFLNRRSDALECINSSQKSKAAVSKKVGVMVSQAAINNQCVFCSGDHYIGKCSKFLELPVPERKELVANKKLCFNCLSSTHQAVVCRSKFACRICRRKHHITLHLDQRDDSNIEDHNEQGTSESNKPSGSTTSDVYVAVKSQNFFSESFQAILPTAIVLVADKFGQMQKCRALLDSGSQSSFISENCAQRLCLRREKTNIRITGLTTGNLTAKGKSVIVLQSMYGQNVKTTMEVLIIKHLPTYLPKTKIFLRNEKIKENLELADPNFHEPASIDLLIGADKFFEIMESGQRRYNSLILQKTMFGWIVSGQPSPTTESTTTFNLQIKDDSNLEQTLRKFWEIEDLPNSNKLTPEEVECEQFFVNTHHRRADGRYVVKLPFKRQSADLGNSLQAATRRFRSLERKLLSHPELRNDYVKQMREYIDLGHMIEIPDSSQRKYNETNMYYLPHHPVMKETSSTTKMRVVFDGSSKTSSGVSLNDKLMIGPTIQPTLWATLLRFRGNKIALVADIEKMYRQIVVSEDHRSFQSILWRENPEEKMRHYQLTRVTFGLACSAFLAIRTLQQFVVESENEEVNKRLLNDFYVDDLLTGTQNLEEAIKLRENMANELAKGGFVLRKWKSNHSYFSRASDEEIISDMCFDKVSAVKTLGLKWHNFDDTFAFEVHTERDGIVSKRKIISESSRLFDPLGFLSPSIVILKILFQKLWLMKVDWDDNLPSECVEEYMRIRAQFNHFENIKIPRFTNFNGEVQIHGFADASEVAYCAVIYSRVFIGDGRIVSQILTSKTKVAPIKKISLPRLELCAAHLLAKLMSAVKEALQIEAQYFAWTDSSIVLAWLSTYPARWKTFIANRTSQILEHLPRRHWAHVRSNDNPADHGSRGVIPQKLKDLNQWWRGPEWLVQPQESWPVNNELEHPDETNIDMEYSKAKLPTVSLHAECDSQEFTWIENLLEKEFKLQKIFRVMAYVSRFVNKLRSPKSTTTMHLTPEEIQCAKITCIRWTQRKSFKEDIEHILKHQRVSNKSRLLSLAPFVDSDGILRVGGRLQNSDCSYDSKHPILLPQKDTFTTRLIWDVHLSKLHAGPTLTSHFVRQNYWVIHGRSRIRSILKGCVICKRYAANTSKQIMGNLPTTRVTPTRPFENCGIDFAGPIQIAAKKGRGGTNLTKGYICIFVCFSVKAVHIECVTDLTSEAFLAAMKRFVARRGIPKNIYTDNGTNFIGARRILERACKLIKEINNNYIITEFLSQNGIEWHFIPPVSPHFGGLWEATVKSVKGHLLKATHSVNLTFEEMTTLLCQIENILNSRPLCTSSTNDDFEVLTPTHFLIGMSAGSIPEQHIDIPENRLSRWQTIQSRTQTFWKRYYVEYLNNMQQRHKWQSINENFKIGDVVLIKEDNTPACKWPLGQIIEVHPGKDELVRAVTLKTASSRLQRPVVKLVKLPVG